MPNAGELTVLGFIMTPKFSVVLGKGDDAAARIKYEFTTRGAKFTLSPMTSDKKARAVVALFPEAAERNYEVCVNGAKTGTVKRGEKARTEATLDATIEFRAVK